MIGSLFENKFSFIEFCFVTLLISLNFAVNAQEIKDAATCSELMKFGIYDESNTTADSEKFKLTQAYICSLKVHEKKDAVKSAETFGIDLKVFDIPIKLSDGSTVTSENWEKWQEAFCALSYEAIKENYSYMSTVRTISPVLMAVVKECINSEKPGLRSWIEPNKTRTGFTFYVLYKQFASETPKVKSITVVNQLNQSIKKDCTGINDLLKDNKLGGQPRNIICNNLKSDKTYTVKIHTDHSGDTNATINAVSPKPSATLAINNAEITKGNTVILSWTSSNANKFILESSDKEQKIEPFNETIGQTTVTPVTNTTYILHAFGTDEEFTTSPVSVNVKIPPPTANFMADKLQTVYQQPVVLTWDTTNATLVTINDGTQTLKLNGTDKLPNKGSITVNPIVNTNYTLSVYGTPPQFTKTISVKVIPRLTAFRNTGLGGGGADKNDLGSFSGVLAGETSSIAINTNEWVVFQYGCVLYVPCSFLLIKGPKNLDNLHAMKLEGYEGENAHWGDKYIKVAGYLNIDLDPEKFKNNPFDFIEKPQIPAVVGVTVIK